MSVVASQEQAQRFVEKWSHSDLSERAASHEHSIDLCKLIYQPAPDEADPTGQEYCFENPVKVVVAAGQASQCSAVVNANGWIEYDLDLPVIEGADCRV